MPAIDAFLVQLVKGRRRGGASDGEERSPVLNEADELLVAQGLPPYTEMTRLGIGFQVLNSNALAALVARPTTLGQLTIWNGEQAGGKSYIVERLFALSIVTTAAEARDGLWACLHPAGMAKPTADITAIKGTRGQSYGGLAVVDSGATVVDDGWFPWGTFGSVEPTGVLPSGNREASIIGRLIIPPQGGLSIQVVSSVAGNTYQVGALWYEKQLALP